MNTFISIILLLNSLIRIEIEIEVATDKFVRKQ